MIVVVVMHGLLVIQMSMNENLFIQLMLCSYSINLMQAHKLSKKVLCNTLVQYTCKLHTQLQIVYTVSC